jgi:hypothetical protein
MALKSNLSDIEAAQKALDLLQEVVWAIRSRDPEQIAGGLKHLQRTMRSTDRLGSEAPIRSDHRKNKKALVGSMPLLLADIELFPANEDIVKFAFEALKISVPRWEKRSRYELIGMIIMETITLSEVDLKGVARFVKDLDGGGKRLDVLKSRSRQTGFSWNETIRKLGSTSES